MKMTMTMEMTMKHKYILSEYIQSNIYITHPMGYPCGRNDHGVYLIP